MKTLIFIFNVLYLVVLVEHASSWDLFTCPPGQVYNSCGSTCNSTCEKPVPTCDRMCTERCECPTDKPFYHDGKCIAAEECKDRQKGKWPPLDCPPDQIYQRCGSLCNVTCDNHFPTCKRMCVERCGCPPERPFYHKGKCVKFSKCEEKEEGDKDIHDIMCPASQQFQICGSRCNRTCEDGGKIKSCARICVTRCGCPYERPIWHRNRCIPVEQCPKDEEDNSRNYAKEKETPIPVAALSMMEQALALLRRLRGEQ